MHSRILRSLAPFTGLALLSVGPSVLAGCGDSDDAQGRQSGQSDFSSAPPIGQGGQPSGAQFGGGTAAPEAAGDSNGGSKGAGELHDPMAARPDVKETDLYRVDGNRLYYLNAYRGLMVFDITNVDDPKLLGRSPIFGTPVEMIVKNGIASIVIGDWYGNAADGQPFHGSVVRTINAQNPADIKVTGEVQVKGWARDMRVVGTNLYIVSQDYGWYYGMWYYGGYGGGASVDVAEPGGYYGYGGSSKVIISSVSLAGPAPVLKSSKEYDGYSGAFNVTSAAIIMAHDVIDPASKQPTGKAKLEYLDITDLGGAIAPKGSVEVDGLLNGWSADNGRWNVSLDGATASVLTCAASQYGYCNGESGYRLTNVDFTNPSAPSVLAALPIATQGWSATARFFNKRMYLSPREGGWSADGQQQPTPVQVYDLANPAAPVLAGQTTINGAVWLFMPVGTDRMFALGNEYGSGYSSSKVALRWLDVADAANPSVLGTSTFGGDWAWTPAAGTFKAFVRDADQKLVVVPFSGWNQNSYEYTNGVQLISYDTGAITTGGAAKAKGWVERGILAKNRVISLSDQALSVVDYTNRAAPKVTRELTLARNVISAQPQGSTIAQLSTDWWGYDNQKSELRILPLANAEELKNEPASAAVSIDGSDARVFRNGDLAYVVTTKYPKPNNRGEYSVTPHVQIVDLANGGAVLKGSIDLPAEQNSYWSWWGGCWYWDWFDGSSAVQVGQDVLAFRRVRYEYSPDGKPSFQQKLYVVDLADANAPKLASTSISPEADSWWGNMRVVGNTLYTSHYEWLQRPVTSPTGQTSGQYFVKYYLDSIDLSDRANPKVGQRINVPGMLVGASETDPSMLYFVDYRWYGDMAKDELAVAKIEGGKAYLQSSTLLEGWVGNVFVRGSKAYMSAQDYTANPYSGAEKPVVRLHEVDLTDAAKPVVRSSAPQAGWGWLVDVEGDRAIITSGWGQAGLDIYRLHDGAAPTYDQFTRTRGWWHSAITRQDNDLFISTGYWGVQRVALQ